MFKLNALLRADTFLIFVVLIVGVHRVVHTPRFKQVSILHLLPVDILQTHTVIHYKLLQCSSE